MRLNHSKIFPLAVRFSYLDEANNLVFLGAQEQVCVSNYQTEISSILKLCDGLNSIATIRKKLPNLSEALFSYLLDFCFRNHLIRDPRLLFLDLFPANFRPIMEANSLPAISPNCFRFHLTVYSPSNLWCPFFEYDVRNGGIFKRSFWIENERLAYLLDSQMTFDSAVVISIGIDFEALGSAYSNNAHRFACIQVGRIYERIRELCSRRDLFANHILNYHDRLLSKMLRFDYPQRPVLSVICISRNEESDERDFWIKRLNFLKESLRGTNQMITVLRLRPPREEEKTTSYLAVSKVRSANKKGKKKNFSGLGMGRTSAEAMAKAAMEAFERSTMNELRIDKISSATRLDRPWIDPRNVTPIEKDQLRYHVPPIISFDPEKRWQWVSGVRMRTGESVYVAIDNVFDFDGKRFNRRRCCPISSNGMAAHADRDSAIQKAALELIERDAIMVLWYSKRKVFSIPAGELPISVQNRIAILKSWGYVTKILDITLDSVPVILAIIYSTKRFPHFCCGAAASYSREEAVEKAFQEAETIAEYVQKSGKKIHPVKISTINGHGQLYSESLRNLHHVEWLIRAREQTPPKARQANILSQFDMVVIQLNPKRSRNAPYVFRVISENLLPINFGYGTEYYLHPRLKTLGLSWSAPFPSFPHFFP